MRLRATAAASVLAGTHSSSTFTLTSRASPSQKYDGAMAKKTQALF